MDIYNNPVITKEHMVKCFEAIQRVHPKARIVSEKENTLEIEIIHTADFLIEYNKEWSFVLKGRDKKLPYKVEICKRYDGIGETAVQGVYYDVVETILEMLVKFF
jgi:hypothetical protein